MEIGKVSDSDFECVILDSDNYEDKINQVGIPNERGRQRNVALTEEEPAILRSELGKLMRIARIARPGAIYDASAAAQTFPEGKWSTQWSKMRISPKMQKREIFRRKGRMIMSTFHVLKKTQERQSDVNKVDLLKKNKKTDPPKTHFTVGFGISEKGDTKIKGTRQISNKISDCRLVRK